MADSLADAIAKLTGEAQKLKKAVADEEKKKKDYATTQTDYFKLAEDSPEAPAKRADMLAAQDAYFKALKVRRRAARAVADAFAELQRELNKLLFR